MKKRIFMCCLCVLLLITGCSKKENMLENSASEKEPDTINLAYKDRGKPYNMFDSDETHIYLYNINAQSNTSSIYRLERGSGNTVPEKLFESKVVGVSDNVVPSFESGLAVLNDRIYFTQRDEKDYKRSQLCSINKDGQNFITHKTELEPVRQSYHYTLYAVNGTLYTFGNIFYKLVPENTAIVPPMNQYDYYLSLNEEHIYTKKSLGNNHELDKGTDDKSLQTLYLNDSATELQEEQVFITNKAIYYMKKNELIETDLYGTNKTVKCNLTSLLPVSVEYVVFANYDESNIYFTAVTAEKERIVFSYNLDNNTLQEYDYIASEGSQFVVDVYEDGMYIYDINNNTILKYPKGKREGTPILE